MLVPIRVLGDTQYVWKVDLSKGKTRNDEWIYLVANAVSFIEKFILMDLIF